MTPAVVQGLALAWLAVVSVIVVAAIPVGLTVISGWQKWRAALEPKVSALGTAATKHETQLDGLLTGRIAAGAAAVIAVHEAQLPGPVSSGVTPADPAAVKAARIAALQTELAQLQA